MRGPLYPIRGHLVGKDERQIGRGGRFDWGISVGQRGNRKRIASLSAGGRWRSEGCARQEARAATCEAAQGLMRLSGTGLDAAALPSQRSVR